MSVFIGAVGALILVYWLMSMATEAWNRPMLIKENGAIVLIVGIGLVISAFFI